MSEAGSSSPCCLLLIHPAVTTTPELLENTKKNSVFGTPRIFDQFLINKLNDASVKLEDEKYDIVYYLTPEAESEILFPKKLIPVIHRCLKPCGKFYGLSEKYKVDALINGFVTVIPPAEASRASQEPYHWLKKNIVPAAAPLARPVATGPAKSVALPVFRRKQNLQPQAQSAVTAAPGSLHETLPISAPIDPERASFFDNWDASSSNIISDDEILSNNLPQSSSSSSSSPLDTSTANPISMVNCPKTKTKRRRACKDCTCGLKEEIDQEIQQAHASTPPISSSSPVLLQQKDLSEIDFTIQGKAVGGCGSCSLGDAFRCSGCPYLGLPAFKPGQPINISSISDDL